MFISQTTIEAMDNYFLDLEARQWITGFLGKPAGGGAYLFFVPGKPGKQYMRVFKNETVSIHEVTNDRVPLDPDLKVWARYRNGELCVEFADPSSARVRYGDNIGQAGVPTFISNANTTPVQLAQALDGKSVPSQSGGLKVFIYAFEHADGTFPESAEDQEGDFAAIVGGMSSNAQVMVISGVDSATNTISLTAGTEQSLAYTFSKADAAAISLPAGVIPSAAWVLRDDQTELSDSYVPTVRWFDMRQWLNQPNAGIAIDDGTTSVDPAVQLSFDPTYFDVTDNGGGQAAVTLIATADAATTTYTPDEPSDYPEGTPDDVAEALDLIAARTVGSTTPVYTKWDVDAPPISAHASDDEFEGSVSGSWTDFDHGSRMAYAASPYGKGVRMVFDGVTPDVAGLLRAAPMGDFSVITRVRLNAIAANSRIFGIILAEGTGSTDNLSIWCFIQTAAGSDVNMQFKNYAAYATTGTTHVVAQMGGTGISNALYLRVRVISGTAHLDVSMDGHSWSRLGTDALGNLSALNYIGIGGSANNATNGQAIVNYDFFRVTTNTDIDTPVHGQPVGIYAPPP